MVEMSGKSVLRVKLKLGLIILHFNFSASSSSCLSRVVTQQPTRYVPVILRDGRRQARFTVALRQEGHLRLGVL